MRWQGREGSRNVEDRRSAKGPAVAGGGILAIVLAMLFAYFQSGGDVGQAVRQGLQEGQRQAVAAVAAKSNTPVNPEEDQQAKFAAVVLKDTEDVWDALFPQLVGKPYRYPKMVLFRDGVQSACGHATAAVGPFYCPGDSNVYLDLSFFDELRTKFKAEGDFACAYVIAHEVGHHIQNLLGLSMKVQRAQSQSSKVEANQLSVRLELQADFLAGVWAHHAQATKQILEEGDLGEAIRAAQAIGDDTLQREATGTVRPDAFTHGTSEQRIRWFTEGVRTGEFTEESLDAFFSLPYDQL